MSYFKAFVVVIFASLVFWLQCSSWFNALVLFGSSLLLLLFGWRKTIRIFFFTFRREVSQYKYNAFFKMRGEDLLRAKSTCVVVFQETVKCFAKKTAFIFEEEKWTFEEVDNYANKVANYFKSVGYRKGDVIAIFLENKPEFVCLWLGLGKIGVTSALINVNVRKESLIHSIKVGNARCLIFGSELAGAVKDISCDLDESIELYSVGISDVSKARCLDHIFQNVSSEQPPLLEDRSPFDHLLYLYTSGTTGLPKATPMIDIRLTRMNHFSKLIGLNLGADDIIYIPLPLYHATGGCLATCAGILNGATIVLRRKFSASNFWKDCVEHKVTVSLFHFCFTEN